MRYGAIRPRLILPLAGLAGIALLVGVVLAARALTHKEELPPTGSELAPAPAPARTPLPQPAITPREHLSVKDLEEAMEEREEAEDILQFLRSRLDTYAQGKQVPLPALPPLPAAAPHGGYLSGPLSSAAPAALREPTIREVQLAAIRYAEVMPEKISRWRWLAQLRNLIPRFTVGLDQDRDTTIASSTSAGKTTFAVGPEDESVSLDFGFTWDLANLVWDSAQTSIDVRSRLMVQLRREVLQEVTRLYFERQRLLAEFEANPTDDPLLQRERALRLEELTAQLDALTGGLYSAPPAPE